MSKINDRFTISHFECSIQDCSDPRAASRWAWQCLENSASVFCEYYCDRSKCSMSHGNIENFTKYRKAISEQESQEQWEDVQKQLHEAMAHLPELAMLIDICPACAIAEAFSCFPLIAQHSPRSPVATVKMNGVDCYPEVVFFGGDQRASFPCVVIKTTLTDFETLTEERLRESALLTLNVSELPPMPMSELDGIKKMLIPGQRVVKRLDELRQIAPTGEGLEEQILIEDSDAEPNESHAFIDKRRDAMLANEREAIATPPSLAGKHPKDRFVLERKEVGDKTHWIVNGMDKGAFFVRPSANKAMIIEALYDQIGRGWVPHKTFMNACAWRDEAYFPSLGNPGCMQRQLTDIRNFLGVQVRFRKCKGVRFAENVVKSE